MMTNSVLKRRSFQSTTRIQRAIGIALIAVAFFDRPSQTAAQEQASRDEKTPSAAATLTLDRLFVARDFEGQSAPRLRWSRRTSAYYTLDKSADGTGNDLVRHDPESGSKEIAIPAAVFIPKGAKEALRIDAYEFSADESKLLIFTNSKKVWRQNTRGDYWLLDISSRELKQLGGDAAPSSMMFARLSPDGTQVAYVRENNLYVQDLASLTVTALTSDGSKTLINGTADWVNEEELNLRDCFRWHPKGKQLLFWQFDTSGVSEFHLINNVQSNSPRIQSFAYPKVGETNSATRVGVISSAGGAVRWLNLPGENREHYVPHAEWTPDGSQILVQRFNRLQNELKLWLADPSTGEAKLLMTETDAAWLENENSVKWLDDGKGFLWLSERTGWRHAYRGHLDGSPLTPITQGSFDVIEVEAVDEKSGWLYFAASPDNATQRYLYRARLDGNQIERVSPVHQPGWHKVEFSRDAKFAMKSYSTFTTPPVVELIRTADQSVLRTFVDNTELRKKLGQLNAPAVEFIKVDIGDGITLDGWVIKPPGAIDSSAKLPLVMHVYGEPYGSTVRDAWPGANGLWHWMLAQQGFVVASVDNRGTNVPRGRAWRKVVHRQIGIIAPGEQARAVRELLNRYSYIDPARVGSWGWSGGGSMSLNAIFRYPDIYRAAIAIAPVPDQRLYDTIYQERYMGLPKDNPTGFVDGSPLTHARQLRGHLMLIHGTGDDNCHYQGTERLMNQLIASGKHFSILPYPNRSHDLHEGENTGRHFWGEMSRFLDEKLKASPAPTSIPAASQSLIRPKLQIINGVNSPVDVFWLKSSNERVAQGAIEPGQNTVIDTTLGHHFVIVNRADKSETFVTSETPVQGIRIGGVPEFYTQQVTSEGFPIVASANVNPYALKEAAYIIDRMLARRPDVRLAMIKSGARLCIIAHNEFTMDLPEWEWMEKDPVPGFENIPVRDFWDARARGMGGSETDPFCSCGEENLLAFEGDPYSTENILIHELAHNIHLRGMNNLDPTFDTRLKAAYDAAMKAGLWSGKYASVNHHEYFAEGVQSWFDDNRENDHDHNHVNTRVELIDYDPRLADLCREVFGNTEFRYTKPTTRLTGHLAGYDPGKAPKFEFPPRLAEAKKLIRAAAQRRDAQANQGK